MQLSFLPHPHLPHGRNKPTASSLAACKEFSYKTMLFPNSQYLLTGCPKRQEITIPQAVSGQAHFEQLLFRKQNMGSYPGSPSIPQTLTPCHRPPAAARGPAGAEGRSHTVPGRAVPRTYRPLLPAPHRAERWMELSGSAGSCCCPSSRRSPGC